MHKKERYSRICQCVLAVLLQVSETVYESEECVIMACCDVKFELLTTTLLIES